MISPPSRLWILLSALLALLLVPFFTISATAQAEEAVFYTWPAIPTGTIGTARPDIQMKMSFAGLALNGFTMTLDGRKVAAAYDQKTETFRYAPEADLTAGKHAVSLQVAFKGYSAKTYRWSFTVTQDAVAAAAASDGAGQKEALRAVNAIREQAGLSPVVLNAQLSLAAAAHAGYQSANGILTHQETAGKKEFTGTTLADRIAYYGYSSYQAYEDIRMQSDPSAAKAVSDLYAAPYHRIPFLDPELKEIGYSRSGAYHVLLFGAGEGQAEPAAVASPVGSGVGTAWDGHETPDPLRLHAGTSYPLGIPLMAGVYGKGVVQVMPVEGSLQEAVSGQAVPLLVNGADKDSHLSREVLYLPVTPLRPNTEYHARVVMKAVLSDGGSRLFTKEWSFQTSGSSGAAGGADSQTYTTGGSAAVLFRLGESAYSSGGTVYSMSAQPLLIGGSAYLPLRDLGRALAAAVSWDEQTQTAGYSRNGRTVRIPIGSSTCTVNGVAVRVSTPARLVAGRTVVPVRLAASLLGLSVDYRQQDQTILVSP